MTLITGDPDVGKSMLTLDWAARLSIGADMPDGKRGREGTTVFLCHEDDAARTVKPRFLAAGGDPDRACLLDVPAEFDGGGAAAVPLSAAVQQLRLVVEQRSDVKLVVIDPLNAYLAGVNTSRDGEVRAALGPLIGLARRRGFAVVGVVHHSKSGSGRAIHRSLGSVGVQALARASWLVAKDPRGGRGAGTRVMLPVKFNLGRTPPGVAFTLVRAPGRPSVPMVRYDDFDLEMDADEAVAAPAAARREREPAPDRAARMLRELFSTRQVVASGELRAFAAAAGVSWRSVERAIPMAGLEAFKAARGWAYRPAAAAQPDGGTSTCDASTAWSNTKGECVRGGGRTRLAAAGGSYDDNTN